MDIVSINGERRFKVGLIDLLTKYDAKKYMENELKAKLHGVD